MKNHPLVAFLVLMMGWSACDTPEQPTAETGVIVSGQLHNISQPNVNLDYLDLNLASDTLDENGHFQMRFELDQPGFFNLTNSNQIFQFYAEPGDSIFIEMDMDLPYTSFRASGARIAENTYLLHKDSITSGLGINRYTTFMAAAPADYIKVRDSLLAVLEMHYEVYPEKGQFSAAFTPLEKAFFTYEPLLMDKLYPNYHQYTTGNTVVEEDYLTEALAEQLKNPPSNQPELLSVAPYRSLLEYTIQERASAMMQADTTGEGDVVHYFQNSWALSDTLLEDPSIRQYFQFTIVNELLDFMGPAHVDELYTRFQNSNPPQKYVDLMEKNMAKWEDILPGKEVPDFAFTNVNDEEVHLSDLRGSLVYVDIWATWCGPCIAEHPHWDALKENFKEAPIAFLTVSIDNTPEPWKKMVADKGMDGYQWYASGAWQSDFAQHFIVTGIPRFILIDEEGKIIDPSAKRPSGGIAATLQSYLDENGEKLAAR